MSISPEDLVEKMREVYYSPLIHNRDTIIKSSQFTANEMLRVVLKAIEDGGVVDWHYEDDIKKIGLTPDFKAFLAEDGK